MLEFVNKIRSQERARLSAATVDLHASYTRAGDQKEKRLISLALGVHYMEKNPRLALQYLTLAELECSPKDPLYPMIRYYLAEAKFQGRAYKEAIEIASSLVGREFGDTWNKKVQSLLIESLHADGNYTQLATAFRDFKKRYNFSRRQEILARMAFEAFEKNGENPDAHSLLEGLAANYPATAESRWAFRKLEDATCKSPQAGGYSFSEQLLLRLSKNVVLGNGLSEFMASALFRPVVDKQGHAHLKAPYERARFYMEARLFDLAKAELEHLLEQENAVPDSQLSPNVALDLAKVSLRVFQPLRATQVVTDFIYRSPKHMYRSRAQELLGDSLRYSGEIRAAAASYGIALERHDSATLRWMRFWNLYRSKQLEAALAMLDRPGYVTPREGDDHYIVKYWHARILDQLGRGDEAKVLFSDILNQHGNSFYGVVTSLRHPELTRPVNTVDTKYLSIANPEPVRVSAVTLAAKSLADRAGATFEIDGRADLKLIADLHQVGLYDAAAAQLSRLRWVGFDSAGAFAAITKLSADLDDYRPSRNLRYTTFTSLRSIPSNWDDLMRSQIEHQDEWRLFYPLAYERIVVPMANHMQLSPLLVLSIMRAESHYNREARSPVGASGLMQLMPYTALKIATLLHDEEFDIREVTEPEINIGYGLYYLDRLLRYYGENPFLAAAAYNAGPHAVNQWLGTCRDCTADEFVESIPYFETRRYVREVMRSFDIYSRIYLGRPAMTALPEIPKYLPENEDLF